MSATQSRQPAWSMRCVRVVARVGEQRPGPRPAREDGGGDRLRASAVRHRRGRDGHHQQAPMRVHRDVALAPDDPLAGVEVARPGERRRHRLAQRSKIPPSGQELPGLHRSPHGAGNTRRPRRPRLELPVLDAETRRPIRPEPLAAFREASKDHRNRRCAATAVGSDAPGGTCWRPSASQETRWRRSPMDCRRRACGARWMRGQQLRARLAAESAAAPAPHPRFAPADADRFALVQRPARSGDDAAVPEGNPCPCRQGRPPSWPRTR